MSASHQATRILIVEDDETLSNQVAELLQQKGYEIERCTDGISGLTTAISGSFHLILLDILLPGLDGLSVLKRLRKNRQTPVMMLTACGAEEDRIMGYSQGADDYLAKPFNPKELLLRIDAILRRTLKRQKYNTQPRVLEYNGLTLFRGHHKACYLDLEIVMTPIEFRLLWALLDHHQQTLSKPFLYQLVLERSYNRHDRSLDMHISKIRRKLEEVGMDEDVIQTVHGQGYRIQ